VSVKKLLHRSQETATLLLRHWILSVAMNLFAGLEVVSIKTARLEVGVNGQDLREGGHGGLD